MLIILDACRTDAIQEVASEYPFITEINERRSVGSTSNEWIAKTFTKKYQKSINQTSYITSNLFATKVLEQHEYPPIRRPQVPLAAPSWKTIDIHEFQHVDFAWEYVDHTGAGGFPPRVITDRTIQLAREQSASRFVVHYMQPHAPYIAVDEPIKEQWLANEIDKETVWEAYIENLRYVLNDVELLLNNVDAERVIITADHGEAFREWGVPGHMLAFPQPDMKNVPWIETTATDNGSYEPRQRSRRSLSTEEVEQRLSDLGYA
jgi:hypothetical protein